MSMGENEWREKAQSLQAQLNTLEQAYKPQIERVKQFKSNFGVRERSDGSIVIDYDKLVKGLGPEGCLELRKIIDSTFSISGNPGEKPKIKVRAG